jgi:hypothetical protein
MTILYFTHNMGMKISMPYYWSQRILFPKTAYSEYGVLSRRSGQSSKEQFYLLGYNAVQSVEIQPMFRRNMPPQSSRLKVSLPVLWLFLAWLALQQRRRVPPKHRLSFQRTTRRHIPEDRNLHNHQRENLRPYKAVTIIFLQLKLSYLQPFPFN